MVCVGKVKEKFYRDAVAEYVKRLGRYCRLELVEVADEKTPEGASASEEEKIKEREAGRILEKIREDAFVCTLEIAGKRLSSVRWQNSRFRSCCHYHRVINRITVKSRLSGIFPKAFLRGKPL